MSNVSPPIISLSLRDNVRYEGGKWVGWTPDGSRIVSVGNSPNQVRQVAQRRGLPNILCEWVLPANERFFESELR
jgi:hypothetical protein